MKMKDQEINQDWERESLKDLVYLQETQHLLELQVAKDLNRQPASIVVIDKDKILEKRDELKYNTLPF